MGDDEYGARTERFVQDVGVYFERLGMPRMAGRVFGYHLIAEEPLHSMDDLTTALNASRGGISNATRYLIGVGLIERTGIAGERRDYFTMRSNAWVSVLRQRVESVTQFKEIAQRGLEFLEPFDGAARQRLGDFLNYCEFVDEELLGHLEQWGRNREERTTPA